MEQIVTLIQTVGFPIACAIAMFLMLNNEQKAHKEESQQLTATITDLLGYNNFLNRKRGILQLRNLYSFHCCATLPEKI